MFKKIDNGYFTTYEPIINTVDAVIFTVANSGDTTWLAAVLMRRNNPDEPFHDTWALPGGTVHPEEDADNEQACMRVIREKIGFDAPYLEQLMTFSGRSRDPRGWSSTVVHYALVPWHLLEHWWNGREQVQASEVMLLDISTLDSEKAPALAFDHRQILDAAVSRLRAKAHYSSLPCHFLPDVFTLPQMHSVYEAVRGEPIDIANFRRKIEKLAFIKETKSQVRGGRRRPATLYRLKDSNKALVFDRMI